MLKAEALVINRQQPDVRSSLRFVPEQVERKMQADKFGAFVQVFVKKKGEDGKPPHIACLSYPLPGGITGEQAEIMLREIIGFEKADEGDPRNSHKSPQGDLQYFARPGADFDETMIDRFFAVPQRELGIDQKKRRNEFNNGGVRNRFEEALKGERFDSARGSPGTDIFDFSYVQEADGVYGKDVKGKKAKKPLSQLAMEGYDDHRVMLENLQDRLMSMEEGVIVNFDKSATVSKCCALFFKEKLKSGVESAVNAFNNFVGYIHDRFGPPAAFAFVEEVKKKKCEKHKSSVIDCGCSDDEKLAQTNKN